METCRREKNFKQKLHSIKNESEQKKIRKYELKQYEVDEEKKNHEKLYKENRQKQHQVDETSRIYTTSRIIELFGNEFIFSANIQRSKIRI